MCDRSGLSGSAARSASVLRFVGGSGTVKEWKRLAIALEEMSNIVNAQPLSLCLAVPTVEGCGGGIGPEAAFLEFKSLWVASSKGLVVLDIAGSRDGGLIDVGRRFSSWYA